MPAVYLGSVTLAQAIPLLAQIQAAVAAIMAQLDAIASFSATIRILALADIEAQLSASLDIQLGIGLSIADPTAYLAGLLSALVQVSANISLLIPAVTLSLQLSASLAISVELAVKIAAFDLALNILVSISAAIQLALPALPGAAAGIYVLSDDGPIDTLGADLQTAIAAAGIPAGTPVHACVLVCFASNSAALAGLHAVLLT